MNMERKKYLFAFSDCMKSVAFMFSLLILITNPGAD